jgi:hypothetical protein
MSFHIRLEALLATLALLCLSLPADAAPIRDPKSGGLAAVQKYFPDDTDGVFHINVKSITASQVFTKGLKKQTDKILGMAEVKAVLKQIGLDPTKDIDAVTLVSARSNHSDTGYNQGTPIFFINGKFDSVKIKATVEKIKQIKSEAVAGGKLYQLNDSGHAPFGKFATQLDKNTIMFAPQKTLVVDAIAKAAGKKKTKFKHAAVAAKLKAFKADVAIQAFALEQLILNSSYTAAKNPKGGGGEVKATHHTLAESGFKGAAVLITVKDVIQGSVTLTAKDKDEAKAKVKLFTEGIEEAKREGAKEAERNPAIAPAVNFLGDVKIKAVDDKVIMEAKATAEVIQSLIEAIFMARGGPAG